MGVHLIAGYCFNSIPGKISTERCLIDNLILLFVHRVSLNISLGKHNCTVFAQKDLVRRIGYSKSSFEAFGIHENKLLWRVLVHLYFYMICPCLY